MKKNSENIKKKSKFVCLFGGPGIGKSATGLELAGLMKKAGMSCEYVPEAVKGHVWDNNQRALSCQPKIFGDQLDELHKLDGKADFIVTDSPLPINLLHNGFGVTEHYKAWIIEIFNMFDNINILLTVDRKTHPYEEQGRYESKERAAEMDNENNQMLINRLFGMEKFGPEVLTTIRGSRLFRRRLLSIWSDQIP